MIGLSSLSAVQRTLAAAQEDTSVLGTPPFIETPVKIPTNGIQNDTEARQADLSRQALVQVHAHEC